MEVENNRCALKKGSRMKNKIKVLIAGCAIFAIPQLKAMGAKRTAPTFPYLKYQTPADKDLASRALQARLAISTQKGLVQVGEVKGPGASAIEEAYQKLNVANTEKDLKKITTQYMNQRTALEASSTQQANKTSSANLQNIAQKIADLDKAYLDIATPGQATKTATQKPTQAETGMVPKQKGVKSKSKPGMVTRGLKVVGTGATNPGPLARRLLKKPEKQTKPDFSKPAPFETTE